MTSLHLAAEDGRKEVVDLLLKGKHLPLPVAGALNPSVKAR
jgi:hypothetical protein